jgi:hypothetical protein
VHSAPEDPDGVVVVEVVAAVGDDQPQLALAGQVHVDCPGGRVAAHHAAVEELRPVRAHLEYHAAVAVCLIVQAHAGE